MFQDVEPLPQLEVSAGILPIPDKQVRPGLFSVLMISFNQPFWTSGGAHGFQAGTPEGDLQAEAAALSTQEG